MRKRYIFILIFVIYITQITAQGIVVSNTSTTPDPTAILDVQSTSKGLLVPRMTQSQRIAIANPANGLLVFQTDGLSGFYYNAGSTSSPDWIVLNSAVSGGWSVNGTSIYYNSGRVGIGVSSPESILHLAEVNSTLDGSSGVFLTIQNKYNSGSTGFMSGIRFRTDGVGTAPDTRYKSAIFHRKTTQFGVGSLHFAVNNEANDNCATFADTRMTIASNGYVGIGTTTPNAPLTFPNNLSKKITLYPGLTGDVGLAVAGNDFRIYSDNVNARISFGYDDYVSGFISRAYIPATGTTAMVVQGDLQVNSTTYTSDIRYKTNIDNIENGLNKVMNLRGVTYLMRQKEFPEMKFDNKPQIGLIAQEVEMVVPEVVTTSDNGYKSIDYARLVPLLIEGMKAQQQQIEDLKKEKDKQMNVLMKEIELIKDKLK